MAPGLVDIALDLQIAICTFLHPSDILTLRNTCKTLQFATRKRIVWITALRQVCLENTLFLPSFPIPDMSDRELEQAAIGPRRWIELSNSCAAQGLGDLGVEISPIASRVTEFDYLFPAGTNFATDLELVPGGRYMVGSSVKGLCVWDLGYTSSASCKLIASVASVGPEGPEWNLRHIEVQPTSDGMGLGIYSFEQYKNGSFYEIYPQSETPQLKKIASLDCYPILPCISGDKVIWCSLLHPDSEVVLRVRDFRLNASACFKAQVDPEQVTCKVNATETAIILLHKSEILIWAIPHLSPSTPNDGHDPTQLPPHFRIKHLDSIPFCPYLCWRTTSSWYLNTSQPLYFDKVNGSQGQVARLKLIIKPDLSDATLHLINTTRHGSDCPMSYVYQICEDTLVSSWKASGRFGIHTVSALSHSTNPLDVRMIVPVEKRRRRGSGHSVCPASGRFVYFDGCGTGKIVVLDFTSRP